MNFFKNLFSKGEPFVPTPTQSVPGLEPIVVQVIETLFPNANDHKDVFAYSIKFKEREIGDDVMLLAVLALSNGNKERLIDLDSPDLQNTKFWLDVTVPEFRNMKSAEKWVKSLTKTQD